MRMNILYGISSNGQGHINRSRIFINELKKDGHDVHVVLSGAQPPEYAYKLAEKTWYKLGPRDIYHNNRLSYARTIFDFTKHFTNYFRALKEVIELIEKNDYDAIFSDFEPFTSMAGKRTELPVIGITHQNSLFQSEDEEKIGRMQDRLAMKFTIKNALPHYSHCFAIDYVHSIEQIDNLTLFPLIWKPELDDYKQKIGNRFLVYLPRYNKKIIEETLPQFPQEQFIIYGFNIDKKVKNITYKKTSRTAFLEDLASCKAVIANTGFSLTWEICLLDKLVWAIPVIKQYEQIRNAAKLEELGRAFVTRKLSNDNFKLFSSWLEERNFRPDTELPILPAAELMKRAYQVIERERKD
jgi:uncharacterized protein (TIGR00661 family)